jgi:hypothetical protein
MRAFVAAGVRQRRTTTTVLARLLPRGGGLMRSNRHVLAAISTLALCIGVAGCGASDDAIDEDTEIDSEEEAIKYCPEPPCEVEPPPPPPPPPPRPNLKVTIVNAANSGYCAAGAITFRVTNVCAAPAGASVVRADFDGFSHVDLAVPALPVGASSAVMSVPLYYAGGDLSITVTADVLKQVVESNESDNKGYGFCLG